MASLEVSDHIATITIADCAALSRHAEDAGRSLRNAIHACDDRDDVKVIILRADGKDFCKSLERSGAKAATPAWWNEVYAGSAGLYQSVCYSKKVTITAVQGECAGAGSLLVLCSDLTVATATATFRSPFDTLPEASFVLASLTMRLNRAKAWMLDDTPIDAQGALAAGLINRIADKDPIREARDIARTIAKMPLDGIAISKLMFETCLDAQGVGQDFDMAEFYAAKLPTGGPSSGAHRA